MQPAHARPPPANSNATVTTRPTQATHLLVLEEREEADARDLDHLEAHTGDVTHGVAGAAEPGDQHLVLCVVYVCVCVSLSW